MSLPVEQMSLRVLFLTDATVVALYCSDSGSILLGKTNHTRADDGILSGTTLFTVGPTSLTTVLHLSVAAAGSSSYSWLFGGASARCRSDTRFKPFRVPSHFFCGTAGVKPTVWLILKNLDNPASRRIVIMTIVPMARKV